MELSQILGWTATIIFTLMYVPQIWTSWTRGKVDDVSLPMFIAGFVGNIVALCYATLIDQKPLQIKYILALAAIGAYLWVYYKIRTRK